MAYDLPTFSISRYDSDGDAWDEGVFFHFGNTSVKVAKNAEELKKFIKHVSLMETEILENLYN